VVVTASGYPPFGDRCERLLTALTQALGPGQRVIAAGTAGGEREALWRWHRR
jgi:hypothetical protein